jgi:ubiquinone/menaquinone biosynthesis C-methylase UbiE
VNETRQEIRERWAASARGWERRADLLRAITMPVSAWMIDAIAPQPGHTVLDLGAGPGDTGFLAAELIEPGGTLICSDVSPEMLSVAQRRAEAFGLRNVRFRQIDAEAIDQPAASLDAVLCRWGYMLMADSEAALRETRRVLRLGGRLALAAWAEPEANPWTTLAPRELIARGRMDAADLDAPGQFAWRRRETIADRLDGAGFVEYEIEALDFEYRFPSVREWWDAGSDFAVRLRQAAATLTGQETDEVLAALADAAAPWTADDGSLALPARTWVAVATV